MVLLNQFLKMKILQVKILSMPEIKIIRFQRFHDSRGYFAETFKRSDVLENPELEFLKSFDFTQFNESFAKAGVVKGLHFQWQPPLGKLLRTVSGHMVDMILDIRKNSPTVGKIIMHDMPSVASDEYNEWIWLPPGFAHGSYFLEDSLIEYFFTADYNPKAEAGISPFADDLDWSLCEPKLREQFEALRTQSLINDRDRNGFSFSAWNADERSGNFIYA